ncbi:MAG: endopeptidase La, partial [bacterium]|nr:endopeptidase La [bacterium]
MDRLRKDDIVLPLIPLRELVAFPSAIIPILVGRVRSLDALKYAWDNCGNLIFLSVQKNQLSEKPTAGDISEIGVIARVEKSAEQENGSYRVIVHGLERASVKKIIKREDCFLVHLSIIEDNLEGNENHPGLAKELIAVFQDYISLRRVRMHGIVAKLEDNNLSEITDIIASVINVPIGQKQVLLEENHVSKRAAKTMEVLKKEVQRLQGDSRRFTRGQPSHIPGREDPVENDTEQYKKKIKKADFPKYVEKRADEELERLAMMPPFSAESTVSRSYIDWLLAIPWTAVKKENKDIKRASAILDEDHYGLEKVKDRILDYLAVRQLVKKPSGEILCFVGPPGVGKSSLSKSIARALDRP